MAYYDYEKRLANTIAKVKSAKIPEANKKILFDFLERTEADGISPGRQERLLDILLIVALALKKPFRDATKSDLIKLIASWENHSDYKAWTIYTYKSVVKKFWKWLKGNDEFFPDEVRWIKNSIKANDREIINANELFSEDDVLKLIDACDSLRDKAFIAVMFDSGARPKEIITLRYGDVIVEQNQTSLRIHEGKTGQRVAYLFLFPQLLAQYMNVHPTKLSSDPLWLTVSNSFKAQELTYSAANEIIKNAARKAKLNGKKITLYNCRHSRASMLAKMEIPFAIMQRQLGHRKAQTTLGYIHLHDTDLKREMKKAHGEVYEEEEKVKLLKRKPCPRCKKLTDPNSKFCNECGSAMDFETMAEAEQKKEDMLRRIVREETDLKPKRWEKVEKSIGKDR